MWVLGKIPGINLTCNWIIQLFARSQLFQETCALALFFPLSDLGFSRNMYLLPPVNKQQPPNEQLVQSPRFSGIVACAHQLLGCVHSGFARWRTANQRKINVGSTGIDAGSPNSCLCTRVARVCTFARIYGNPGFYGIVACSPVACSRGGVGTRGRPTLRSCSDTQPRADESAIIGTVI